MASVSWPIRSQEYRARARSTAAMPNPSSSMGLASRVRIRWAISPGQAGGTSKPVVPSMMVSR